MAQRAQVLDITKSYYPCNPESFVHNLVNTQREDGEEQTFPILAFEGWNFIPTNYGYRSYFGRNNALDVTALSSRAQFVLSFQLVNYRTKLIALCEDGIWSLDANTAGASWVHEVTYVYDADVLEEWSYCVIENVLYMYQQGRPTAYKTVDTAGVLTFATHTPSFLNMAGQMGIFKAGLRLGFWDSQNSVSWSSNLDLTDFTPAIETMAGNTIFGDIIGRIVTVRSQGEGYIIYCTKAIVGVSFSTSAIQIWESRKILDNVGVYYPRAVTYGHSDFEHFVYSSNGIYKIGKFDALANSHEIEQIVPDVYDFLKEPRDPVYLDTINSRYVFFGILNPDYVYGFTAFDYTDPQDLKVTFTLGGYPWNGQDLPAINLNCVQAANVIKHLVTFGFVSTRETTARWTAISTEMQMNTTGPLAHGVGSRNAETPGFTTQNIVDNYILTGNLPAELNEDPFEHVHISEKYIGNVPQTGIFIEGAESQSLIQYMYKQQADWELFRQHQGAAFERVGLATRVVTTPGVTAYYSDADVPLPDLPANTTTDTVIGTYPTGRGNVEIQLDKPTRRIIMRKYLQEAVTITKRKVTSYSWRAAGTAGSIRKTSIPSYTAQLPYTTGADTTMTPATAVIPAIKYASTGTFADHTAYVKAQMMAVYPPTLTRNGDGQVSPAAFAGISGSTTSAGGNISVWVQYNSPTGFGREFGRANVFSIFAPLVTMNVYYQDVVETYSYIISAPFNSDQGYYDFTAEQTDYAHTIVQVTSDPPTIVVHSPIPIFPTGPSAVTFFPPTWNGVETLKIIAASAYNPWHLIDGTFGIEVIADAITGAPVDPVGEVCENDSPANYPGTEFGTTYTGFPILLQKGSPVPLYPILTGALVYDLNLKKWGKLKANYQTLIDLIAINVANIAPITGDDKGMTGGLFSVAGDVEVFDDEPTDSTITYGKIGHYRLGMSDLVEVKVMFRDPKTGVLTINSSMNGRDIDPSLEFTLPYTDEILIEALPDISARWHLITLTGTYDIVGLEPRDVVVSRR